MPLTLHTRGSRQDWLFSNRAGPFAPPFGLFPGALENGATYGNHDDEGGVAGLIVSQLGDRAVTWRLRSPKQIPHSVQAVGNTEGIEPRAGCGDFCHRGAGKNATDSTMISDQFDGLALHCEFNP